MPIFEDVLEELEEMLEEAWNLPMTGGKCVIDGEKVKDKLESLRINFPGEIKRARAVVEERDRIISKAKSDAEQMILGAEKRREVILNDQAIVKDAKERSNQILKVAQEESIKMRKAAVDFIGEHLRRTEEMYEDSLTKIKQARRSVSGEKPE